MGHRVLKRVALNFKWPIDKVWKGYVNPRPGPKKCRACDGSGYHPDALWVSESFYRHSSPFAHDSSGKEIMQAFSRAFGTEWIGEVHARGSFPSERTFRKYGSAFREFCEAMRDGDGYWLDKITQDEVQALVDEGRLMDFTHTCKPGEGWKRREDGYIPTAAEVNAHQRRGGSGGHDCINRWILIKARLKRFGIPGNCPKCRGKGAWWWSKKARAYYAKWKEYEPPAGEGYQLWETCSEGSPQSPVFASAEELADWCAENATIFGSEKTSRANWLRMFVGETDIEAQSMLIGRTGGGADTYVGPLANMPVPPLEQ